MEIEKPAVETTTSEAAPEQVVTPTLTPEEDLEAKYKALEVEKENYKSAFLKEKAKHKEPVSEGTDIRAIVQEELQNSRIVQIAQEQDSIINKALKENKELKLASLNSQTKTPPAAVGSHTESVPVTDTSVTQDQVKYFKETLKWSDKDIERYKKNVRR